MRNYNNWMNDEEFLSRTYFHDKEYFFVLAKALYTYIASIPIPVVTAWFASTNSIRFSVGSSVMHFTVDTAIHHKDFIFLVNKWLCNFFPRYTVEKREVIDYSPDEVLSFIQQGLDIDTILSRGKEVITTETGVIESIMMRKDEFILTINDKRFLYVSGTLNNFVPLSIFLKEIRHLRLDVERYEYITANSTLSQELPVKEPPVLLRQASQLEKFFKIRMTPELVNIKPETYEDIWIWGEYKFKVESERAVEIIDVLFNAPDNYFEEE